MTLLKTKNLGVSIAGKIICKDLNLEIEPGQCWGMLGKNGSGKTTLLHTLAGLREKDSGSIYLEDQPIDTLKRKDIARKLGILFQDSSDPFPSTVLETALIGRHPHLSTWQWENTKDKSIALQALMDVELNNMEARQVTTLSGGERRRLAMATLLTQNPDIALLDEPTNHLDLHHQMSVLQLLKDKILEKNKALVMSLHDINLATRFCTHIILLYDGKQLLHGPVDEMLTISNLEQVFDHPMQIIQHESGVAYLPK